MSQLQYPDVTSTSDQEDVFAKGLREVGAAIPEAERSSSQNSRHEECEDTSLEDNERVKDLNDLTENFSIDDPKRGPDSKKRTFDTKEPESKFKDESLEGLVFPRWRLQQEPSQHPSLPQADMKPAQGFYEDELSHTSEAANLPHVDALEATEFTPADSDILKQTTAVHKTTHELSPCQSKGSNMDVTETSDSLCSPETGILRAVSLGQSVRSESSPAHGHECEGSDEDVLKVPIQEEQSVSDETSPNNDQLQREELQEDVLYTEDDGWANFNTKDLIRLRGTIMMYDEQPIQPGKDVYHGRMENVSGQKGRLAVKLLKKEICDFKEIDDLKKLKAHDNIVKIMGSGSCNYGVHKMFIAMEYCPHNLYEYIEKYPFHLVKATTFFQQTVCAIAFIHGHKIAHRDLKPSNILITIGNSSIKVADFGICKQIPGDQSQASVSNPRAGTEGFKAPETYEHGIKRLGYKADIFPLGICGYYTVTHGNHPFGPNKYKWAGNILDDKHRDLSHVPHFLDDHKRSQLISLLQCMLKFNPKDRPTAQQAQNDVFFEELHRSFEPQSSGGYTTCEPGYPTEPPSSQVEQNATPDGISEESEMPSSTYVPRETNHKQVSSIEVSRATEHNQVPIEENLRIVDTDSAPFPSGGDLARLQEQEENSDTTALSASGESNKMLGVNSGFVTCTSDFDPARSPDQRSSSRLGPSFAEPRCVHSDNPNGDDCLLVKNQVFHNEEQLLIYCLFWIDNADHSSEFESHSKSCPVEFHACPCDTIHFTVSTKSDEYSINEKSELEEFLKLSFFKTTNNDQIKRKIFQFRVDPGPSKIEDKHIEIDYHVRVESQKTQGVYIRFNNLGKHEHIGQVCKLCRKKTDCSPPPVDKSVHNYYGDYSKTAMNMADNGAKMEMSGNENQSALHFKQKSGTESK